MVSNPVWEICERVAEVQAPLDDHIADGKHRAADVVAKAQAVLSEPELLRRDTVPHIAAGMIQVGAGRMTGQQIAYLYFEDEPQRQMSMKRLSRDEAFLIAVNIAKLPSVPRQILKDIPRPPNSASRDD
jgi:hypothetical protein